MLELLGPVSSPSREIGFFDHAVGIVVASMMLYGIVRWNWRARKIRQNAARGGFAYLGNALPRSFPLHSLSFRNVSGVSNVVQGDRRGNEFLFFDLRLGTGKHAYRRSVVALRGPRDSFGVQRFDPSLLIASADSWTLLYRDTGVFSPDEVDAILSNL